MLAQNKFKKEDLEEDFIEISDEFRIEWCTVGRTQVLIKSQIFYLAISQGPHWPRDQFFTIPKCLGPLCQVLLPKKWDFQG